MADTETATTETPESGQWASHTHEGITSSSNHETADEIKENLESEPKPEDGEPPDPEAEEQARLKKAAADLGKKGGEAKAEKDAAEKKAAEKKAAEEKAEEERKTSNRTTAKQRVEQATQEAAALKRERKQLIQERDEARARLNALKAAKDAGRSTASDDPSDPAPDPNQYEDTPEGAKKLIRDEAAHAARQEHRRLRAESEARAEEARNEQRRSQAEEQYERYWEETLDRHTQTMREAYEQDPQLGEKFAPEVASLVPSYVVYKEGGEVQPIHAVADEIIRAENTKAVMLYLSENPEAFQRIAALKSPRDIVREVAIIDARVSSAATPVPAKRTESSKAPPPIRPVVGSPTTADPNELSDDLPTDEWFRRAQAAKRVRR